MKIKTVMMIIVALANPLSAMQSQFNNTVSLRFGPDSHIYNTPLYFNSLNNSARKKTHHPKRVTNTKKRHHQPKGIARSVDLK